MSRRNALIQEKTDLTAEGKAIFTTARSENRDLSEAELERDEAINARLDNIDRLLAAEERQLQRERVMEADHDFDPPPTDTSSAKYPRPFRSLGDQMNAVMQAAWTPHKVDERLYAVATGAGEAVDSDGAFLVQSDFTVGIIRKMYEIGTILSRVQRIPTSSGRVKLNLVDETSRATGSRWGGVTGYWVDEGTAPTATKPKFFRAELEVRSLLALGYGTNDLVDDAPAMNAIYAQAFAEELVWLVEEAIINGTGAGQPLGVVNGGSTVSVAKETGQAAATVVFQNIVKMWSRMWARSRSNAAFFINQDVEPQLFQMSLTVGTGGVPVYLPANGLSGSPYGNLMGRPVIPVEHCPTLGTTGDIMLLDLSQYGYISKGEVEQETSMHFKFDTNEKTFRATIRVDGRPLWRVPLTPAKGSNTLSPFVKLDTRA